VLAYFGTTDNESTKEICAAEAAFTIRDRFAQISENLVKRGTPRLQIRCGITTGYVTFGYLGGLKHAAYTIVGRSVNLASRLQTAAEPGQIIVDKNTAARLEGKFELTSL